MKRIGAFLLTFVMLLGVLPTGIAIKADAVSLETAEVYLDAISSKRDGKTVVEDYLIDFNGDGNEELLITCREVGNSDSYMPPKCSYEVWSDGKLVCGPNDIAYIYALSLCKKAGSNQTYLVLSGSEAVDSYFISYTLKNGKWVEEDNLHSRELDDVRYFINGNSVSGEKYSSARAAYTSIDFPADNATGSLSDLLSNKMPTVNTAGLTAEMARAYLRIVDDCVSEYGGYTSNKELYFPQTEDGSDIRGFAGGMLMDLNGDACPELVTVCTDHNQSWMDVWIYRNGNAELVAENDHIAYGIRSCDSSSFFTRDGKMYFIRNGDGLGPAPGGAMETTTGTIYALQNNRWNMVFDYYHCYEVGYEDGVEYEKNTYYVTENGKKRACDAQEYDKLVSKYSGSNHQLSISEGAGCMSLAYGLNGKDLRRALNQAASAATGGMGYLGGVIPYYGDMSKMKLSAEVAETYAELIRGEYWDHGVVYAAMFDGGNGVPMIWIASGNGGNESYIEEDWGDKVYTCIDGQVRESNKWISALVRPGENGIVAQEWEHMASDFATNYACLRLSGGRVAETPFASGTWNPLDAAMNGDDVDEKWEEFVAKMGGELDYLISATSGLSDYLHLTGEWCEGNDAMMALEQYANEAAASDPRRLLSSVPYIGNLSKCKLTPRQALGYAEAIESLKGTEYEAKYVVLVDVSGDGYPILVTNAGDDFSFMVTLWHIVDGNVCRYHFETDLNSANALKLAEYDGKGVLTLELIPDGAMGDAGTVIYACKNGKLTLIHSKFSTFANVEFDTSVNDFIYDIRYYIDGIACQKSDFVDFGDKINYGDMVISYWWGRSDAFGSATDTAKALRAYAAASSAYSFPKADSVDEAALVEAIAKAVADAVGGEISGIYKLADGVYYVIITVNGSTQGTLVLGSRENGEVVWNVSRPDTAPLSEEELKALLADIQSKSNLSLDFSTVNGISTADAIKAIRDQLNNMSGLMPTDPAKSELADYIQSAISAGSTITLSGSDNRFAPDPDEVAALRDKAEQARNEYEKLLEEYGITLNRAVTIIIRIVWNNMDSGAPCQIELNEQLLSAMEGCEMQLLLGDTRHYIRLSSDMLRTLVELYGCVKVQMAVESDGIYTINFLDENDRIIERLDAPVGFGLPAETSLSTVVVSYEGGSRNWGGQYDPNSKVISFDASYSGRYEILENAVEIVDISELDEEIRAAVAFLVSKGYMTLEGDSFLPDEGLNRYQFTQALVGMFFALNQNQTTGFVDVPADSPYYPYVASGESLDVIKGYEDNRFCGEDGITIEQMLALAARTLIQYKAYAEPTTPGDYLNSFSDGHEVSDWAQSQVALAVREGLVDRGGELRPADIVTRGEAALILYRLFLLLHEVPVVELELPEVSKVEENGELAVAEGGKADSDTDGGRAGVSGTAIAIVIIIVVGAGGASWWFLKKKKERN